MPPIAKCSECGGWVYASEDYREKAYFYAHERCIPEDDLFWT
jgi:hypothetical protein